MSSRAATEIGPNVSSRTTPSTRHRAGPKSTTIGPALAVVLAAWLGVARVVAADLSGRVTFGDQAVPGAAVTASKGDTHVSTVSDEHGGFTLIDLGPGTWTVTITMPAFDTLSRDVIVPSDAAPDAWPLTMLSVANVMRTARPAVGPGVARAGAAAANASPFGEPPAPSVTPDPPAAGPHTPAADPIDGLAINGSVNNGSASPIAQSPAFGNNRRAGPALYSGGVAFVYGASSLDARPFSFSGTPVVAPEYQNVRMNATLGGPIKISRTPRRDPTFFISFQHARDHSATTQPGVMPTAKERAGDFSQSRTADGEPVRIVDPTTGQPFPDSVIPSSRLSPQALALLQYFPLPAATANGGFNYQTPVLAGTSQTLLTSRITQALSTKDQLIGLLAYQHLTSKQGTIFGFSDASGVSGLDATATWLHRIGRSASVRLRYQFTGVTTRTTPHFANRTNVSAEAGVAGNDQEPSNWGPPTLQFPAVTTLRDANAMLRRDSTNAGGAELTWAHGHHTLTFGGDLRHRAVFDQSPLNARGTFTFTGDATGSDLADFLLGLPTASAIQSSGSDRRFRAMAADGYVTDDWRFGPTITMQIGVRWEVETPPVERRGRLVNLDVAPDFSAVSPVLAGRTGTLTGRTAPAGLMRADWSGVQPRLGIAWRPIAGSSFLVRGGYGAYRNAGLYLPIAQVLSQQPPVSTASSVISSAATPLSLAEGFTVPTGTAAINTFAVDPDLRVGVSHNWQLLLQRDVWGFLTISGSYLGTRGARLLQEYLPNTYPAGAAASCPTCPSGFVYLTSDGHSTRHAGQWQVRWRLHRGLAASLQYTLSKATDDAAAFATASLGGSAIAQDWLNPGADEARSDFDQRHRVVAQVQYLTGIGMGGGGLMSGMKARLLGGWTITSQVIAGSGLPFTPIYLAPVGGTGLVGSLRPSLTGASTAPAHGRYLNPDAYAPPQPGRWGDTPRNSVTGPRSFSFDLGVARTFELTSRLTFDWRLDATNVLNRETYTGVNAILGSAQFGRPNQANSPRRIVSTARLRF
jgi:hypothetical protein